MRKSLREQVRQTTNTQLMSVDDHDFLAISARMEDVEPAAELGMTKREVDALKNRLTRS
ncbi:hypothetical protein [Effusibacillus lacus]|uniref:Uncharacterized protein n=1 Tax=Effusibacillus lacus TaxID=1348429 RepID=A0A292YMJ3_9BACL|nr:hypothetical protein [Effusibacillus lacus]TCS71454.1 hypothetical protein EDD64_12672 [Effusibacillus lacus]GAX89983.1 hypothetical protein EFBL_1609 [Effusibacillus lacus]